jgi:hypothetical protein
MLQGLLLGDRFNPVMGGHSVGDKELLAADRNGTRKVFDPLGFASGFLLAGE